MNTRKKILSTLLVLMRTVAMQHQHAHWGAKGCGFYGDHLLFERLYNTSNADIDALAEKVLGLTGDMPSLLSQISSMSEMASIWRHENSAKASLVAEQTLLRSLEMTKEILSRDGSLTLGLEDHLGGMANQREEHIYLLKQRLKPCGKH